MNSQRQTGPYSEDELLPVSALCTLVFCERRAALQLLERMWEDNVFTIQGSHLHQRVHEQENESRGDVRVARGLPLRSLRLGLVGVADVVEFHRATEAEGGVALPSARGRWRPFPVEYKRGKPKPDLSDEVQLCAQAMCLEEMLGADVPAGAMFYGRTRRRHDVTFDECLRRETEDAARRLHELVESGKTPPPVFEKKCQNCSLVDECMPRAIVPQHSAIRYMEQMLDADS